MAIEFSRSRKVGSEWDITLFGITVGHLMPLENRIEILKHMSVSVPNFQKILTKMKELQGEKV